MIVVPLSYRTLFKYIVPDRVDCWNPETTFISMNSSRADYPDDTSKKTNRDTIRQNHARKSLSIGVEKQMIKWLEIRDFERQRFRDAFDNATGLLSRCDNGMLYGASLRLFGSTTSGLALGDSDLDLCVLVPGLSSNKRFDSIVPNESDGEEEPTNGVDERRQAVRRGEDDRQREVLHERKVAVLRVLERQACQEDKLYHHVSLIRSAKVPVLKFRDRNARVFVDISVGNGSAVLLSRLFRKHVEYDRRVWFLCMVMKQWARNRGICGVYEGHINSMGWVIMAIFFLQHVAKPAVATMFQYERIPRTQIEQDDDVENDEGESPCGPDAYEGCLYDDWAENWILHQIPLASQEHLGISKTVASALMTQFFKFFANEFDFKREVISLGLKRRTKIYDFLGRHVNWQIFIEQPLKPKENIVKHVEIDGLKETAHELARAAHICENKGDMFQLLEVKNHMHH